MPNILIATPVYQWSVTDHYMTSLRNLERRVAQERSDIRIDWRVIAAAVVHMARNTIATMVYNDKSITHLLFIDSDIGFRPEAIFKMELETLISKSDGEINGGDVELK